MSRFLWDECAVKLLTPRTFSYYIIYDVSLYLDVLPFIGLLLFHYRNFKPSKEVDEEPEESTDTVENLASINENEDVVYLDAS